MYQGAIIKAKVTTANAVQSDAPENESAELSAQEILDQAHAQAEKIKQEALVQAGEERDIILAKAQSDGEEKIAAHILKLSQDFRTKVRQQEAQIGKVVSNTIRKIISDLPSDEVQRDVLKTALRNFADETAVSICVSPSDFDKAWWKNWKWAMDNNFDVNNIIKDTTLDEGRCIIQFADQKIDIGIKTQLASLDQLTGQSASTSEAGKKQPNQEPEMGEKVIDNNQAAPQDQEPAMDA